MQKVSQELQNANALLEGEVAVRTAKLLEANQRLEQELTERKRSEEARAALQEEIIRAQNTRLLELSTPIIPITDDIMVMPLVGTLDAERAGQVLFTALNGVRSSRSDVVIIDITGMK